jgi:integrating conjugative element protein (TIGR03765 family)
VKIPSRQFSPRWLKVLLVSLIASPSAFGDLIVIYDNGQTKSIAPLLRPFHFSEELLNEESSDGKRSDDPDHADGLDTRKSLSTSTSTSTPGPGALSNLYPVRSPALQVGDLAGNQLKPDVLSRLAQGNPRPFFLIGSDQVSLRWLATHRDVLKSLGAVGMLVQADTEHDVRQVADVAGGLSITLGSGNDLASALGIYRYPVLITREGITQ